jgi:single-stranded DNA-binding protein|tara:strand:- start:2229 stop:2663 length:435 start_codon:yes stop_codon:yes gene_type:complete
MMQPEIRQTRTGKTVAKARMVIKTYGDADDMWVSVNMWENLADNFNYSFPNGSKTVRAMVTGRLQEEKWTGKDGNERKEIVITADQVAICLDYQTVNGITYQAGAKDENSYNNNTDMAKDVLGAVEKQPEPVARTNYGEDEAPF